MCVRAARVCWPIFFAGVEEERQRALCLMNGERRPLEGNTLTHSGTIGLGDRRMFVCFCSSVCALTHCHWPEELCVLSVVCVCKCVL